MTENLHPLSESRAAELWEVHIPERKTEYLGWQSFPEPSRRYLAAIMRAAYDAGRDDALKPLDPLAENNGKVLRDVEMRDGSTVDVAILAGPESLLADWSHLIKNQPPSWITAFTADDRTTRYTCTDDGWTAKTLDGDA